MEPLVDIAFDCLPLRSISRVDIPIDATPEFRARCERLKHALDAFENQNAYFLYNTHCTFRLANSEFENVLRFSFDGVLLTDRSDCKAERSELDVLLISETCGGVPPAALEWLRGAVERAILVEFDRFISEGQLAARMTDLGQIENAGSVCGFAGMGL